MDIINKIHRINPSGSTGLENRLHRGNKKTCGKAPVPKGALRFDEYLDMQLKEWSFASYFKKAGQSGTAGFEKSSAAEAAPFPAVSLSDLNPELHIPFHVSHDMFP
jgi:hypothetical protein